MLCSTSGEQPSAKYAFCGDTILMGSLGRTNFDSSSSAALFNSLKLLNNTLKADTLICASHDYNNEFTTTLPTELSRNALLKAVLQEQLSQADFVKCKAELDSHLNDQTGIEIMCGAYIGSCDKSAIIEYDASSLAKAIANNTGIKVIDIREPHEYALTHSQDSNQNVPLTRLVQFIHDHQDQKDQPWVLVCRSGSRSMVAAQAMHRLGFAKISHLKGGYALSH